jgi:hypothetical protein
MGISIYYEVRRDHPLSDEERIQVKSLISKHNKKPHIKSIVAEGGGELFSFYPETDDPNIILEGSVKLPSSLPPGRVDDIMYVADVWLDLMCEIRKTLKGATWTGSLGNDPLLWSEDEQRFYAPIGDH